MSSRFSKKAALFSIRAKQLPRLSTGHATFTKYRRRLGESIYREIIHALVFLIEKLGFSTNHIQATSAFSKFRRVRTVIGSRTAFDQQQKEQTALSREITSFCASFRSELYAALLLSRLCES